MKIYAKQVPPEYEYALTVLDAQLDHCLIMKNEKQDLYYNAMKAMFNIIISDGYKKNIFVTYDDNGKHYIKNMEG